MLIAFYCDQSVFDVTCKYVNMFICKYVFANVCSFANTGVTHVFLLNAKKSIERNFAR